MSLLSHALKTSNYDADPMLRSCGILISKDFVQIEGRVLPAPKLKSGNDDFFPRNGRWNFNNKRLVDPTNIECWIGVNFSACCDPKSIIRDLINVGGMKVVKIDEPFPEVFGESLQFRSALPIVRVEKMFEQIQSKLPGAPQFLLYMLPERKNCDIYGPWKKRNLSDFGIVIQCMAPTRVSDQYLTNLLLKINAKLGGLNSMPTIERMPAMPLVSKVPTITLGMDVSYGSRALRCTFYCSGLQVPR